MALACLAVPLQLGAGSQNQVPRLAYDSCGPVLSEEAWEIRCYVAGWITTPGLNPAWSPDGQRIALSNSGLTIYYLADGSTTVLPGTGSAHAIEWSPDGARIAFTSNPYGNPELFVINADGSALTRLTDNVGFRGGYAWSPDGSRIAFAATVSGVAELFLMQADGSDKIRLTYNVGFDTNPIYGYWSAPSWSPDGARIAFDCANDICSINVDGTNLTRLTFDPVRAYGAVFSPVDGRIAFSTGGQLAILDENGAVTQLAPGHPAMQHAWSPDGQSLAFVEPRPDPANCMDQDNRCVPGQNDMVYMVTRDGSGLQEMGAGHQPDLGASLPGQPTAMFTFNCSGANCQFDATGSSDLDGTITRYVWEFGDGSTSSGATASHQYATGANYIVTLTVTDNVGATSISTRNVSANSAPTAAFTVTCNGPTCTFDGTASSDPDGTIAAYTWLFADDSPLQVSSAVATHVYRSGTFLPQLQVVDSGGRMTTSAAAALTIVNAPPVAVFTATCAGLACTFDASASSDDDVIQQYYWNFGDGRTASGKVVPYTYQTGGTYQPSLTVADTVNQTAASTGSVTVTPPIVLEMHVGNLSGASTSTQKTWNALVTVQIHSATHEAIAGVTVSGAWSDGATATCQTGASGTCVLSRNSLLTKTNSITLTVASAAFGTYTYKPAANHDLDGGSNGTTIVVKRR